MAGRAPLLRGRTVPYNDVVRLLDDGDADALVEALLQLDPGRRRSLITRIRSIDPADGPPGARARREAALLVAGAGCLPRAADVVSWLRAKRFQAPMSGATIAAVVAMMSAPGRPDPGRIALDLAARLRTRDTERGEWALVAAALRATSQPAPATEAVVLGWVRELNAAIPATHLAGSFEVVAGEAREQLTARMAADPWLAGMVPHLLTMPKVAASLGEDWPGALAALASSGRINRMTLVDHTFRQLRSGGRGAAMRPALALLPLLNLSVQERLAHRADLVAMLGGPDRPPEKTEPSGSNGPGEANGPNGPGEANGSSGPVAAVAQRVLRDLDEAGLLDAATVVEACRAAFGRAEKKFLRAHLSWVERAVTRHPDVAHELLELAVAPSELAGKAVTRPSHLPDVRGIAAPELSGGLRRHDDDLLGEVTIPRAPLFPPRPIPYEAERMPPPIASIGELGAAVTTLREGPMDPIALERVLAAIVAFAATSRPALTAALFQFGPDRPLAALITALTTPPPVPALQQIMAGRVRELADQLAGGTEPPVLLATPATVDGHVEPARVLLRLVSAERDGWQPGPFDLAQALLRLPREVDPAIATAAARLSSPAGRRLAAWLRAGDPADYLSLSALPESATWLRAGDLPTSALPESATWLRAGNLPTSALSESAPRGRPGDHAGHLSTRWEQATGRRARHKPSTDRTERTAGPHHGDRAERHLAKRPEGVAGAACWPLVLPGHREIIAGQLLRSGVPGPAAALPGLARSGGPFGPDTARVLASALSSPRDADRAAAVEATVHLARHGGLEAALLGRELTVLLSASPAEGRGLEQSLTDLARSGVQHLVWALLRTLVPTLLRLERPPAGLPGLLALATATATAIGARADLPEVVEAAERPERTRLKAEAARLARALS